MRNEMLLTGALLLAAACPAAAQQDAASDRRLTLEHLERMRTLSIDAEVNRRQVQFTPQKIKQLTSQADVIAIGKVLRCRSGTEKSMRFTFQVSEKLKGELKGPRDEDKTLVEFSAEGKLMWLLQPSDRLWILFLTDQGRIESPDNQLPDHYQMLDDNTGIYAADHADLQKVKQALRK